MSSGRLHQDERLLVGMKQLLPQKRNQKNSLDCTGTIAKTYCSSRAKKSWEELNVGVSSKYLINT